MIDIATSTARPFDLVLVHSMSRFLRDQFLSEMYVRRLRRSEVTIISMTQDFQDGATGNLIRQILGSFDEYQSRENAKHTLRATQENARQGFWNGSQPPFGYEAVVRERRGHKLKKVLFTMMRPLWFAASSTWLWADAVCRSASRPSSTS